LPSNITDNVCTHPKITKTKGQGEKQRKRQMEREIQRRSKEKPDK